MASAIAVPSTDPARREPPFLPVIIVSVLLHLVVFVGIPVLTMLTYHSEKYGRPDTFQLVSPALLKAPVAPIPRPSAAEKPKKAATTPVPAKKKASAESKKQEENTEDLSELLEAVQARSVSEVSTSQGFKYNWYIQRVVSQVEERWKPPMGLTDKKDASVLVSFTIEQNGTMSHLSVATSSGVSSLDNLAMRAIQLAAPFPKLPIGFTNDKLEITYTLHYAK